MIAFMETRDVTPQGSFIDVAPDEGRRTVAEARQAAAAAHDEGLPGSEVARLYSDRIESLLVGELSRALEAHPVPHASLLAMGGFGRRELAPYSDIDLLLVVPADADRKETAALATALFTPLWDAGLEPGHALRTPEEALAGAAEDHTIATALVDARVIGGDSQAGQALLARFWERMHGDRLEAFVQAKCDEMQERRKRHLGSIFLLEPNIKNGVGGLRDMACALWVARVRQRLQGLDGVAHFGLLPRRELVLVRAAYERLLRMRCALHLIAGRRDDRLTFARQEKLAVALGYVDEADTLAVELLMRDYYLAAQTIEHATDAIIHRASEKWDENRAPKPSTPIDASLELFDGHVTFRPGARPSQRPALLVDLFAAAERQGAPVLPSARDLVAQAAEKLGRDEAAWREAVQAFLDYLESPGANGEALRGLYETGVIGALVPAFARLRARVQHDVYHVYTVDAHTLFAVQKMLRLRAGLMAVDMPDFTRTVQDLPEPLHLLVGLLFHDLGKGLGGDHSLKGETIVREWGARAGLAQTLIDDAAFLVREHLRLPQVAFRRDLSDPALVNGVATLVGSRERLDMLYLLTWADISSVGPETWNAWRSGLLAELYAKVRAQFEDDAAPGPSTRDRPASTQAGAKALRQLVKGDDEQLERFIALLPERYLATVSAGRARAHFEQWSAAQPRRLSGRLVPRPDVRGAGEIVVVAEDRPGLLAAIAGAFAANGIDILNAEIFSLSDGRVLDTFLVREPGNVAPAADRVAQALKDLEAVIEGRETARALLVRRRGKGSLWAPGPALPTKVRFDLSAARASTVVDVFTRDRVGLLHDIAEAIHSEGASVVLARIATEGNRAADGFYLQDAEGRKITDPARLDAIGKVIERVLEERARET